MSVQFQLVNEKFVLTGKNPSDLFKIQNERLQSDKYMLDPLNVLKRQILPIPLKDSSEPIFFSKAETYRLLHTVCQSYETNRNEKLSH